ncbi:MAG: bifunctional DNA-formamidopyrimidine glycosylase/DNA-(apurinic or apyrimidinic site) lyase [Candidatus Aminicenantes bacterium]|nr:bifunctional DNA-formamidopyrimidine glycosylase/DNA-(apurinic or apyrimidinic site) lyase [Candidatus Aminicenantes bacterium]
MGRIIGLFACMAGRAAPPSFRRDTRSAIGYNAGMPELPEVETIAAGLRAGALGLTIKAAVCRLPKLLRETRPEDLAALAGSRVSAVRRRGKVLIMEAEGRALLFHLKMTGRFFWAGPGQTPDKHTHFILAFADAEEALCFRDVRKFGFLRCLPCSEVEAAPEVVALGPEPLEISDTEFAARLAARKGRLKSVLLDQRVLAGVGNIYADEALHAAALHPRTPANRLSAEELGRLRTALRRILKAAIAAGGSSVRDYRSVDGGIGDFQTRHKVYGRKGEACRRCGGTIRRIVVGGRAAFYCPRCQRRRR